MWDVIAVAVVAIVALLVLAAVALVVISRVARDIAQRAMDHMTAAGSPEASMRLAELEESRTREQRAMKRYKNQTTPQVEVEDCR